eukprot:12975793-Ditylum_brightwellii.AAC.1
MRRVGSYMNYLGQQDAARKTCPPLQKPDAWSGKIYHTINIEGLYVRTSDETWIKFKDIIRAWLLTYYETERSNKQAEFDYKEMDQGGGFAEHMAGTYPVFKPYLEGRWKYSTKEWATILEEKDSDIDTDTEQAPDKVKGAKRLKDDLEALTVLSESKGAPLRLLRGVGVNQVIYAFCDASSGGFGSSFKTETGV